MTFAMTFAVYVYLNSFAEMTNNTIIDIIIRPHYSMYNVVVDLLH